MQGSRSYYSVVGSLTWNVPGSSKVGFSISNSTLVMVHENTPESKAEQFAHSMNDLIQLIKKDNTNGNIFHWISLQIIPQGTEDIEITEKQEND